MIDDPNRPLPKGLYLHRRQYRARIPGEWIYFGSDYVAAVSAYAAWKHAGGGKPGTIAWLLDNFVGVACPGRVKARTMAPRTARDYLRDAGVLKTGLGHIPVNRLEAKHVAKFRDARAQDAPSHVRNEMACLSAALSWALEAGDIGRNVAMDVRRPSKSVRERLISDDEYLTVYDRAQASVRLAMLLAVRTLGLPADVLKMGPRNLIKTGEQYTLRFRRGKTGVQVEVEVVGELATALQPFIGERSLHPTFVRRDDGKPYTVDGIGAMFRRYCVGTKERPVDPVIADFGLRDLRAKGATEMYRQDPNNIRKIQLLLGHKSVQTTEIYLKGLLPEVVRPNEVPIIASVK
jgi:integrase